AGAPSLRISRRRCSESRRAFLCPLSVAVSTRLRLFVDVDCLSRKKLRFVASPPARSGASRHADIRLKFSTHEVFKLISGTQSEWCTDLVSRTHSSDPRDRRRFRSEPEDPRVSADLKDTEK
ncbi:uncharacterized, partial [Tachysurus ichikawai]